MVTEAIEKPIPTISYYTSLSAIYITGKSLDNVTPVRRRSAKRYRGTERRNFPVQHWIDSLELSLKADDIREKGPWRPFSFEQTTVHIPAPWQLNPVGGEVNTWAIEECRLVSRLF